MATSQLWIYSVCIVCWLITGVDPEAGYYQLDLTGKPTQQSSTQGDAVSSRAVDGNPDNVSDHDSCTHTDSELSWWAVDLLSVHPVYSVTLVNRGDCCMERLDHFRIYGYNGTIYLDQNDEKEICVELSGGFGEIATRTFVCSHIMHSRLVGVQLTLSDYLTLCEVYIHAACEPGRYGENCNNRCSEHCKNYPCDRVTGVCPDEHCKAGYKGQKCDTPCENGWYGEDCTNECSRNCKFPPCNNHDGTCLDGRCVAGYEGTMCEKDCDSGHYGLNCVSNCSDNCKLLSCDTKTGNCLNLECKSGFKGNRCDEECPVGTFGDRCEFNCSQNCQNQCAASSEVGACSDGCKPGYTGTSCETELVESSTESVTTVTASKSKETSIITNDTGSTPQISARSEEETVTGTSPNFTAIGLGVAAAVVVLILVVIVVIIRKRKSYADASKDIGNKRSQFQGNVDIPVSKPHVPVKPVQIEIPEPSTASQELLNETQSTSDIVVAPPDGTYANVGDESKTKLKLEQVGSFMENMKSQAEPFVDEYNAIPKATSSWKEAAASELKSKNRYINILPYDYNRVKLQPVFGDPLSTYINASYIKDYKGQTSYIASLGTTDKTIEDMWRMIWETGISYIIMVTNLVEDSRVECFKTCKLHQLCKRRLLSKL